MFALLRPFLELCLFRCGPQDLPVSGLLLAITLATHVFTGLLLSTPSLAVPQALLAGVLDTGLLGCLTLSVLYLQRHSARLTQTLTALAGAGTLLGLLALPFTAWLHMAHGAGDDTSMPALTLLLLLGWSVAVAGHILRSALSTGFMFGLVVAIVFYWVSINVLNTVFPPPA